MLPVRQCEIFDFLAPSLPYISSCHIDLMERKLFHQNHLVSLYGHPLDVESIDNYVISGIVAHNRKDENLDGLVDESGSSVGQF